MSGHPEENTSWAETFQLQPAAVSKMLILTFTTQHESKHTLHMQSTFGFQGCLFRVDRVFFLISFEDLLSCHLGVFQA